MIPVATPSQPTRTRGTTRPRKITQPKARLKATSTGHMSPMHPTRIVSIARTTRSSTSVKACGASASPRVQGSS